VEQGLAAQGSAAEGGGPLKLPLPHASLCPLKKPQGLGLVLWHFVCAGDDDGPTSDSDGHRTRQKIVERPNLGAQRFDVGGLIEGRAVERAEGGECLKWKGDFIHNLNGNYCSIDFAFVVVFRFGG
jgi:hypothetical protein